MGTLDPERSDVFSKIRKDFDAAGVVQSDEQILRVINELTLQAGSQMPVSALISFIAPSVLNAPGDRQYLSKALGRVLINSPCPL